MVNLLRYVAAHSVIVPKSTNLVDFRQRSLPHDIRSVVP